ncbi:MAG: Rieske (2Fe-2S) protein [Calditrichales bacterium]|nr:MAG: Rieske (2Fe-2S) protein [Calditrichales bacterium]
MKLTRRRFINYVLGGGLAGWLGSVLYPVFSYLNPPKITEANVNSVKAGLAAEFGENSSKIIKFGRKPLILIRNGDDFHAFEATCTHLDCIVQYRNDTKQIWCACHNGVYDLHGRNVSGPPPRPLAEYEVKIIQEEIIITQPT